MHRLLLALSFIHSKNVIHRDLKPSNILLDDDGNPYISDFDHSFDPSLSANTVATHTHGATRVFGNSYLAPELLRGMPASMASDVFALGKILQETCTAWVHTVKGTAYPQGLPEDVARIFADMQDGDASSRPDALSLVSAFGLSTTLFGARHMAYGYQEATEKKESTSGWRACRMLLCLLFV